MGRFRFGREAVVCFWVSLFFAANVCHGRNDETFEVTGIGECVDCEATETGHAYKGLRVTVDCKSRDEDHFKTRGFGELNEEGKFRVFLPSGVAEGGRLKEECFVNLHSSAASPCPAINGFESSSMVVFMAKTEEKHSFGLKDKLKFSPSTCSSAFLWPFFKPFHPLFPFFKKPLPPIYIKPFPPPLYKPLPPPIPVFRKPLPPSIPVFNDPLPPPIPVFKKPLPPPFPFFLKPLPPPIPFFKRPLPPPIPVFKKPLPPPVPVYRNPPPPPVPIYEKPLPPPVPVFQKPLPPPAPIYKPIPPIQKPPLKELFPPHIPMFKKPTLPPIPIYKPKHPYFKPLPPWPKISPFYKKPSSPIPPAAPSSP